MSYKGQRLGFFKLKEKGTTVKTELRAGLTTFLAMLYIVPVNALIMSQAGMPMEALITATALVTIFSTIINGLWPNTPIAISVGMGINAYFTNGLAFGFISYVLIKLVKREFEDINYGIVFLTL